MDVANLAGEKEELNDQLKEMQQSERAAAADGDAVAFRFSTASLHQLPSGLLFPFSIFTELQKAKEAEKQMNSHKVSFERMLQNERTLKIQVCVWAPTHVWNAWHAFSPLFNFRGADVIPAHRLWLRITLSCGLELNLGSTSPRSVRFFRALMYVFRFQAINKLAEVMNRRVPVRGGTEVHRREKENRKLQLELRAEKEKLNSTLIKYQREMTDMQAVSRAAEIRCGRRVAGG